MAIKNEIIEFAIEVFDNFTFEGCNGEVNVYDNDTKNMLLNNEKFISLVEAFEYRINNASKD